MNVPNVLLFAVVAPCCAVFAADSQSPHWIDVLPLPNQTAEAYVADAAFLGNETVSDGIAWSCTLVPEGCPAMDKATVYAERFRRIARRAEAHVQHAVHAGDAVGGAHKLRRADLLQVLVPHVDSPALRHVLRNAHRRV